MDTSLKNLVSLPCFYYLYKELSLQVEDDELKKKMRAFVYLYVKRHRELGYDDVLISELFDAIRIQGNNRFQLLEDALAEYDNTSAFFLSVYPAYEQEFSDEYIAGCKVFASSFLSSKVSLSTTLYCSTCPLFTKNYVDNLAKERSVVLAIMEEETLFLHAKGTGYCGSHIIEDLGTHYGIEDGFTIPFLSLLLQCMYGLDFSDVSKEAILGGDTKLLVSLVHKIHTTYPELVPGMDKAEVLSESILTYLKETVFSVTAADADSVKSFFVTPSGTVDIFGELISTAAPRKRERRKKKAPLSMTDSIPKPFSVPLPASDTSLSDLPELETEHAQHSAEIGIPQENVLSDDSNSLPSPEVHVSLGNYFSTGEVVSVVDVKDIDIKVPFYSNTPSSSLLHLEVYSSDLPESCIALSGKDELPRAFYEQVLSEKYLYVEVLYLTDKNSYVLLLCNGNNSDVFCIPLISNSRVCDIPESVAKLLRSNSVEKCIFQSYLFFGIFSILKLPVYHVYSLYSAHMVLSRKTPTVLSYQDTLSVYLKGDCDIRDEMQVFTMDALLSYPTVRKNQSELINASGLSASFNKYLAKDRIWGYSFLRQSVFPYDAGTFFSIDQQGCITHPSFSLQYTYEPCVIFQYVIDSSKKGTSYLKKKLISSLTHLPTSFEKGHVKILNVTDNAVVVYVAFSYATLTDTYISNELLKTSYKLSLKNVSVKVKQWVSSSNEVRKLVDK